MIWLFFEWYCVFYCFMVFFIDSEMKINFLVNVDEIYDFIGKGLKI